MQGLEKDISKPILIGTSELMKMLSCGRHTAVRIGVVAGARVKIGGRLLWNVEKVKKYLDDMGG